MDVVVAERSVAAYADEPGQVGAGGRDPQDPDLAAGHPRAVGADALDTDPAGVVEQVGRGQQLAVAGLEVGGLLTAVARRHDDARVEDAGDLLGDPGEVATVEHDVGQRGVERVDPGERRGRIEPVGPHSSSPSVTDGTDRWHNLTSRRLPRRH